LEGKGGGLAGTGRSLSSDQSSQLLQAAGAGQGARLGAIFFSTRIAEIDEKGVRGAACGKSSPVVTEEIKTSEVHSNPLQSKKFWGNL